MQIGIDLGGTKIEAIALDENGATLLRHRVPTPTGDYVGTLNAIADLVLYPKGNFAKKARWASRPRGFSHLEPIIASVSQLAVRTAAAQYWLLRPRRRANRAAHSLRPPLRLIKSRSGSSRSLYSAAYRSTRDHLLRVRSSTLSRSAVQ